MNEELYNCILELNEWEKEMAFAELNTIYEQNCQRVVEGEFLWN